MISDLGGAINAIFVINLENNRPRCFQALEELEMFMIINGVPNKNRQKLLRNLRVRVRGKPDSLVFGIFSESNPFGLCHCKSLGSLASFHLLCPVSVAFNDCHASPPAISQGFFFLTKNSVDSVDHGSLHPA